MSVEGQFDDAPDDPTIEEYVLYRFIRKYWLKLFKNLSCTVALPIEDRDRNLTKSILARVCTLNVCGYSTLLRSVQ